MPVRAEDLGASEVAFVERDLVDVDHLAHSLRSGVELVWLDSGRPLVPQVSEALAGRHGLRAIHLVTHGRPGAIQLGAGALDREALDREAASVRAWSGSLAPGADILVYGCDVGRDAEGRELVSRLAAITQADVAASDDATGGASRADWLLETSSGPIAAEIAFAEDARARWNRSLITVSEGADFSNALGSAASYNLDVGANTFSGTVTTPSDGQDNFIVTVPGGAQLTAVNLTLNTGGGFSGFVTFNLNETRSSSGAFTTGLPLGAGSYYVQVVANFAVGNAWSMTFTVASLANTAPTNVSLSPTSVNENSAVNTTVGTLSTTDPDFNNTFTYSLVAGAGSTDNASFNISGNTLRTSAVFDREAKSSYSIRVRTTDQGGLFFERAFTISVNDLNDNPPTVSDPGTLSVAENSAVNTNVGSTLVAVDPDLGTVLSNWSIVSGNAGGAFAINASTGQIRVANSAALNYEATTSYSLGVTVSDGTNTSAVFPVQIAVTNVNEAPTGIAITNATVAENSGGGTVIGTLSSFDPDAGSSFSYSIVAGLDGAYFAIGGDLLMVNLLNLDYEASPTRTVRIRTTDQGGLSFQQDITITITNVNEAPTDVALSNASVMEYQAGAVVGTLTGTDPDAGDVLGYGLLGTDAGQFTLMGNTLYVAGTGLARSAGTTRSITVRVTDSGGLTYDKNFVITVTPFDTGLCNTLTVQPATLSGGAIGTALSATSMNVTGAEGPTTWSTSSTLPAGVTFDGSGVLGGTPAEAGTFPLTLNVTDDRGCTGSVTADLVITCSTSAAMAMTVCGSVPSAGLAASLPTGVTGQWSDGALGGTFSPSASDANATYTPAASFLGPVTLTWQLTGAGCDGVSTTVSIDVIEPGPAGCCNGPADCDDLDPCTTDTCGGGSCSNVVDPLCSTADAGVDAGVETDAGVDVDLGVLTDAGSDAGADAATDGSVPDGGGTSGPTGDGGCSCSVPGGSGTGPASLGWLVLLVLARRRRS